MVVLITGSREWPYYCSIEDVLIKLKPDRLIVGDCKTGADRMAWRAAGRLKIPRHRETAHWDKFGKAAGPIRNRVMLNMHPDLVVAFHQNIAVSRGTKDCYDEATKMGISTMLVTS